MFRNLSPPKQTLRSCLSSEGKKRDKKKKKVQFAENVKETSGNGEEYRKEHKKLLAPTAGRSRIVDAVCRNEMPANRIALFIKWSVHIDNCKVVSKHFWVVKSNLDSLLSFSF